MGHTSDISKYVKYSDVIVRLERDPDFRLLEDSLVKTLDYLSSRYSVRKHYDYFNEPKNRHDSEMLFKASFESKDIMWVYLIHSVRSSYLSVELDPERIESIRNQLSGFEKVVMRDSKPRLKLIYRDYEKIEQSLIRICDCFGGHTVLPQNDINSHIRPKKILRNEDGSLRFVCGRCETTFSKAPRCPECGQLVKL